MFSRSATQDSASAPHGNALWPLLLAQARGDATVWNQFTADMPFATDDEKKSPQYTSSSDWLGNYWEYDGNVNVLDTSKTITGMTTPLTLKTPVDTGTVTAYFSERGTAITHFHGYSPLIPLLMVKL
jgi:hypothetical protein